MVIHYLINIFFVSVFFVVEDLIMKVFHGFFLVLYVFNTDKDRYIFYCSSFFQEIHNLYSIR